MKLIGKLAAILALAAMVSPQAMAQGRKELRINEVMIQNETSVVDDYGQHSAWIELINPTHAPVEISSIYITDDINNPRKYYVPVGDARTKIGKGQTVLFHSDGNPNHGTFYLNFPLTPGQDNFVAVFDANGETLIDSVTVPATLPYDCSYARTTKGGEVIWQVRDDSSQAMAITPGGANDIKGPNNKIENFKNMDENGFAMSTMAMSIVFGALLVLCLSFIIISNINKRKAAAAAAEPTLAPAPQPATDADAETAAAIAMALHQHLNAGVGNSRLTINHNPASAWSNKIYAMRQMPRG